MKFTYLETTVHHIYWSRILNKKFLADVSFTQWKFKHVLRKYSTRRTALKSSHLQNKQKLCWQGLFSLFPKRPQSLRKGEVMGYYKTSLEGIGGVRRADKWCTSNTNMGCSHLPIFLPLQKQNSHISTSPLSVLTQQREDRGGKDVQGCPGTKQNSTSAQHFYTGWKEGISSCWHQSPPVTPNAAALEMKNF